VIVVLCVGGWIFENERAIGLLGMIAGGKEKEREDMSVFWVLSENNVSFGCF
jgi:hypothetical protein